MSVLDQTSVSLALPRIADHFDASIPTVQWVSLGYILTTGALLLPMGRLSDIVGRKRIYIVGFGIFTLGAAFTGSSPLLSTVILAKVFQGVGAAMIQANGMAIVTSAFPDSERGRTIGMFMTMVGLGAIAGPVIGGFVVGGLGWRAVFFMAVPFGIISIVAASLFLRTDQSTSNNRQGTASFDWVGASLSSSSLALFLLVLTNAYRVGWGSLPIITGLVVVVLLFVTFIWWERRTAEPMLALELFRSRLFSLGSSASFMMFLAGASVFFLMPFYLQEVLGYSPGQAGLILAPTAICFALLGPISGQLADRFGWRKFAILGLVFTLVSLLMLSRLTETAPLSLVVIALVLQGMGMGTFYSPNASAVLSTVERSRYGIATAFMNMIRNSANVIGVAIATTIVTAVMGSLGYEPSLEGVTSDGSEGVKTAFARGLQISYLAMSGFVAVAIALSLLIRGSTASGSSMLAEDKEDVDSTMKLGSEVTP